MKKSRLGDIILWSKKNLHGYNHCVFCFFYINFTPLRKINFTQTYIFMIYGILLILLGLVACPSLLLEKKPNAKELFEKIAPYQGWAGVVFCISGIWTIISCILAIKLLSVIPINWILWLLVGIVETSLGFILGYNLIAKHALSKNANAAEKGEQLLKKLTPLQGKLGIVAIVLGILYIIATFVWVAA